MRCPGVGIAAQGAQVRAEARDCRGDSRPRRLRLHCTGQLRQRGREKADLSIGPQAPRLPRPVRQQALDVGDVDPRGRRDPEPRGGAPVAGDLPRCAGQRRRLARVPALRDGAHGGLQRFQPSQACGSHTPLRLERVAGAADPMRRLFRVAPIAEGGQAGVDGAQDRLAGAFLPALSRQRAREGAQLVDVIADGVGGLVEDGRDGNGHVAGAVPRFQFFQGGTFDGPAPVCLPEGFGVVLRADHNGAVGAGVPVGDQTGRGAGAVVGRDGGGLRVWHGVDLQQAAGRRGGWVRSDGRGWRRSRMAPLWSHTR